MVLHIAKSATNGHVYIVAKLIGNGKVNHGDLNGPIVVTSPIHNEVTI